ncbi:hypothetical protein [Nocardia africana]|uniref:Uncharacterized protein n=1 Tax=Nocardia africana TaxID=134964 RepID=A0ABW6NTL4_9NOCA
MSWRGGIFTRLPRRAHRRQARCSHKARTGELSTALGIEIALLRIAAELGRSALVDRFAIPGSRYHSIEEADEPGCVSVADVEAIAELHFTTVAALYAPACDRIDRGDLPASDEVIARGLERAFGCPDDRYFTDPA